MNIGQKEEWQAKGGRISSIIRKNGEQEKEEHHAEEARTASRRNKTSKQKENQQADEGRTSSSRRKKSKKTREDQKADAGRTARRQRKNSKQKHSQCTQRSIVLRIVRARKIVSSAGPEFRRRQGAGAREGVGGRASVGHVNAEVWVIAGFRDGGIPGLR